MSDSSTPKTNLKVVGLAVAGAVGGFLFGFDSSVVNGAVDAVHQQFNLSAALTGFAVASALLGCAIGAYLAGRIADRWGRIPAMIVGAVLFLASAIGAGLAIGVWDLMLWRVVGGLGIGMASVIAPAYIAEISPRKHSRQARLAAAARHHDRYLCRTALRHPVRERGRAARAHSSGWASRRGGGCFSPAPFPRSSTESSPSASPSRRDSSSSRTARMTFARFLPASGRMTTSSGQSGTWSEAIRIDAEGSKKGALRDRSGLKPIVWIGIILSVFQQFVGINVIFYYSTTLWQAVGFQERDSFTISVITSVTNILVTFVAIFLVDRVGRKPILLVGSVGMAVSLGVMALAFSQSEIVNGAPSLPGGWGPLALVAANVFVVFFGASWGPIVWVLLGEIFPNRIRARALGVAAAAQWIANFVVTVSFPPLASFSLVFTYGMYALVRGSVVLLRLEGRSGDERDVARGGKHPASAKGQRPIGDPARTHPVLTVWGTRG